MKHTIGLLAALLLTPFAGLTAAEPSKPNIVYILADDLGYGDVQRLNPERGKIKTPHLDKLAAQGMTFTDAHSGSSVCTPTRYGLLTGRYDQWWSDVQPLLVNESVTGIPAINPFQELYYKQFGGSPTAAALKRMDPKSSPSGVDAEAPKKRKAKAAK